MEPIAREIIVGHDVTAARNGFGRLAFLATTLVNAGACTAAPATASVIWFPLALASWVAFPLCLYYLFGGGRLRPFNADVAVDADALVLDSSGGPALRIPRASIRGAWIEAKTCVAVVTPKETVTLMMPSTDSAEELLATLGHTRERRTLAMPVAGWVKSSGGRRTLGMLMTVSFIFSAVVSLGLGALLEALGIGQPYGSDIGGLEGLATMVGVLLFMLLAFGNLAAYASRRRWVVVGSDGVQLANRAILRHADIAHADPVPAGVRISMKDGAHHTVAFAHEGDGAAAWVERQFALLSRIEEWQDGASHTKEEARLRVLDRGDRSREEHHRELRTLAMKDAGYRAQNVTTEDLERVIDDAESLAERRVAAAVALSAFDRPRAIEKIRVVVPTCVDDTLRAALEDVAREAVVAELDEEAAKLQKRAR